MGGPKRFIQAFIAFWRTKATNQSIKMLLLETLRHGLGSYMAQVSLHGRVLPSRSHFRTTRHAPTPSSRTFFSWMGVFSIQKRKKHTKIFFFFRFFSFFLPCKMRKKSFVLLFLLFVFQEYPIIVWFVNRIIVVWCSFDPLTFDCCCVVNWRACALPPFGCAVHSLFAWLSLALSQSKEEK